MRFDSQDSILKFIVARPELDITSEQTRVEIAKEGLGIPVEDLNPDIFDKYPEEITTIEEILVLLSDNSESVYCEDALEHRGSVIISQDADNICDLSLAFARYRFGRIDRYPSGLLEEVDLYILNASSNSDFDYEEFEYEEFEEIKVSVRKEKNSSIQFKALQKLFSPFEETRYGKTLRYEPFLTDIHFRNWSFNKFIELYIDHHESLPIEDIDRLEQTLAPQIFAHLIDDLIEHYKCSANICAHVDELMQYAQLDQLTTAHVPLTSLEVLLGVAGSESHWNILHFLFYPIAEAETGTSNPQQSEQRIYESLYGNYWAATLEQQTAILQTLFFPSESDEEAHQKIIDELLDYLFGVDLKEILKEDKSQQHEVQIPEYARILVSCYLQILNNSEKRLLVAALIAAREKPKPGESEISYEDLISKSIANLLSQMGGPGAKIAQALHSNPETPENIRADLAGFKSEHNLPSRREFISWIQDIPGLDPGEVDTINHAGSMAVTAKIGEKALNVIRPFTLEAGLREFDILFQATQDTVEIFPQISPLVYILEVAREAFIDECDSTLFQSQINAAEQTYNGTIEFENTKLHLKVLPLEASGKTHKLSPWFNGKPLHEISEKNKKQVAIAVIFLQFRSLLSGHSVDEDRHEGNYLFHEETNSIGYFDFGQMQLEPPTLEEQTILGNNLAKLINSLMLVPNTRLTDVVSNLEDDSSLITNLKRNLLAMGPCFDILDMEEITLVFLSALKDSESSTIKTVLIEQVNGLEEILEGFERHISFQQNPKFLKDPILPNPTTQTPNLRASNIHQ